MKVKLTELTEKSTGMFVSFLHLVIPSETLVDLIIINRVNFSSHKAPDLFVYPAESK